MLIMTDEIDTFMVNFLNEYDEKPFCNVSTDELGLESEEEKKEAEEKDEKFKDVIDFVKETLGDDVAEVRISRKLKRHAVFLTTTGNITFEMEKYLKEMPGTGDENVNASRVLELNSEHSAFKSLKEAIESDKEKAAKMVKIMYGQASIMANVELDDPIAYSDLVLSLF